MTTLVRGRWVVTAADSAVRDDAAVVVAEGRVADVLDWAEARRRHPEAAVIGSESSVVLPGLINAHHHSHAVRWIQHGLPEMPLEPYLLGLGAVRQYDRYLDALLCGARLLSTGVTSAVDLFSGGGTPERFAGDIRALARGYADAGIRVALAAGISTRSFLVYGEDERFIQSLPAELQASARSLLPSGPELDEADYFAVMAEIGRKSSDRFDLWYAAPGPEWVADDFLQRLAAAAAAQHTGFQTHAVETLPAKLYAHRTWAESPVGRLKTLGVLGPRFSIAHGVWLDEAEIAILAETGASVAHNPGSNLRWFAGIAPLERLRKAGVTVGLGMDGSTLNDDEDMFSELRLALRLQLAPALTPRDVLALATTGGAKLLSREHRLGRIAPGYDADLVVLDLERLTWPWVAPEADPLTLLVLRAQRRDIDAVLVGGEVVFRAGAPTRFDLAAATRELAAQVAQAAFPADRAEAARRLAPHVEAWYRAWPTGPLDPYTAYESRG